MNEANRINQLESIIAGLIPHFTMLVNQTAAHDILLHELIQTLPNHTNQALLDTLQAKAKVQDQSADIYAAAAEIVSYALNGEPPKSNIRDILKLLPGGKSDA